MPSKEERHNERAGRVPPASCQCAGCAGLARRYKGDPGLLAFYRRKLLQKGWAGNTDEVEKAYMAAHAGWYRAMQESGRKLAEAFPGILQGTAQREGFGALGKASDVKDEGLTTPGGGPELPNLYNGPPAEEEAPQAGVQLGFGLGEVEGAQAAQAAQAG